MTIWKSEKNNPGNYSAPLSCQYKNTYIRYINRDEIRHLIPPSPSADTEIISIAESIRRFGLLDPIRVYYNADKQKYYIISGERRFAALVLLGRTRILCHVITDIETCDAIIIAEYCLSSHSDIFRASTALEYLLDSRGYSISSLSKNSGISTRRINRLLRLALLTYEERRRLLAAHLPEQVCCEIAEIEDIKVRDSVIEHMSSIKTDVKKIMKEKKAKPHGFAFNSHLIDNSVSKLASMIERTGAIAKFKRNITDSGVTYTISVNK